MTDTANLKLWRGARGDLNWDTSLNANMDQIDAASPVSVKAFGAVGDGSADDTAEIQAALDAAGALTTPNTYYTDQRKGGAIVFCPPGTYKLTDSLTIPQGVSLIGAGKTATVFSSSLNAPIIRNDLMGYYNWFGARLADFGIYGDRTKASQVGLDLLRPLGMTVSNLYIQACGGKGLRVRQGITNLIQQVDAVYCVGHGIEFGGGVESWADSTPNSMPSNNNTLLVSHGALNDGSGLYLGSYVNGTTVKGGAYESNYLASGNNVGYNIELRTVGASVPNCLEDVWVEGAVQAHIYQDAGDASVVNRIVRLIHFGNGAAGFVDRAIINARGTLMVDAPCGHGDQYKTIAGSKCPFRLVTTGAGIIYLSYPRGSTVADDNFVEDQNGAVTGLDGLYLFRSDFNQPKGYVQFSGGTTVAVTLPRAQPDAAYVPILTPMANIPVWFTDITVNGFTIHTAAGGTEWVGWTVGR